MYGVGWKVVIPSICAIIQGTWKQYACYVIIPYLKGLHSHVEVVQMVFYLQCAIRVELDVHSLFSLLYLVKDTQESQWSLSHPF